MEIGPEEEFARAGPLQTVGLRCGWNGSWGGGVQGQKERAGKGCESGCVCVWRRGVAGWEGLKLEISGRWDCRIDFFKKGSTAGGWTSWEQGWREYLQSWRIQSGGRGGKKPKPLGPIQALVDSGLGGPLPACPGASLVPLSPQVRAAAAHPPKRAGSGGGPWHAGVGG